MKPLLFVSLLLVGRIAFGQKIVDPCFQSIANAGQYYGSADLKNLTCCYANILGSDLLEWNGTRWLGTMPYSEVTLPPPHNNCSNRAIWIGDPEWTRGGEAFALRLDQPLQAGITYTFTFTYASDGMRANGRFAPTVYTDDNDLRLTRAVSVGKLPSTQGMGWETHDFSFTAQALQDGHTWLILHATESPGLVLSDCLSSIENIDNTLGPDTLICESTSLLLRAPDNERFTYAWNDGSTDNTILATQPGLYSVQVTYGNCIESAAIQVDWFDCEVRLDMPNIFTPNGDGFNDRFIPIDHNYLRRGLITLYNRWGHVLTQTDLFTGWDGKGYSTGVYYYVITYEDSDFNTYSAKGHVTLAR